MSERTADPGVLKLGTAGLAELLRGILAAGRPARFRAGGTSMLPTLRDGDVVRLVPPDRPLVPGDVAAFLAPPEGILLVHRLVRARGDRLVFKGDAASFLDPPVGPDAVLGLVEGVERNGRPLRRAGRAGRRAAAFLSRAGVFSAALAVRWAVLRPFRRRRTDA